MQSGIQLLANLLKQIQPTSELLSVTDNSIKPISDPQPLTQKNKPTNPVPPLRKQVDSLSQLPSAKASLSELDSRLWNLRTASSLGRSFSVVQGSKVRRKKGRGSRKGGAEMVGSCQVNAKGLRLTRLGRAVRVCVCLCVSIELLRKSN